VGLESATYITDLVDTNPTAGDNVSQGDDHIRLIKSTLGATFSGFTGAAVTATEAELNDVGDIRTDLTAAEADIDALEALAVPVFGHVRESGAVVGGESTWAAQGTPVTKGASGVYTINFPTAASTGWAITTQRSIQNDTSNITQAEVTATTTTSVTLRFEQVTGGSEGADENTEFHFIAFPY